MSDEQLTDLQKLERMFAVAGDRGVFSGDIRREGISGNPSQRIRELEDRGYRFRSQTEPYPSSTRRRGKRWWITRHPGQTSSTLASAPQDAVSPTSKAPAQASAPCPGPATSSPRPQCAIDDDWDWEAAAA